MFFTKFTKDYCFTTSSRATEFRISSRNVRRKFWWQNFRFQMIIGMVAIAIIIVIIYSVS